MTLARDQLSRHDAILVTAIETAAPALASVRDRVDRFHGMIRRRQSSELPVWIEQATGTALASFANGLRADQDAVAAALREPNGQTEGQITELKLVKRQMYGRAKLDLRRARLVPSV
jgi:transposase